MINKIRIATWNLERPKLNAHSTNARKIDKIRDVNADIWVLTETHSAISINGYDSLASISQEGYHSAGESYSAIWSRWPIVRQLPTFDSHFAVCSEINTPLGLMITYGTIITYANDRGVNGTSKRWEEHRKSIEAHASDWQKLRKEFPEHLFCVAGDFNQSRDGSGWYEDAASVKMLSAALEQSNLECVTEMDMRASGLLQSRASIDHICLSKSLSVKVTKVDAWEGAGSDGYRMSDHNGVLVIIKEGES